MPDPNEIGALWLRHGKKGEYMTGTISGVKVALFANSNKTNEKQPDWRVMKSVPREDRPAQTATAPNADDIGF